MEKIQAQFIFEVLGRPASNVIDALNMLIKKMDSEKGCHVLEKIVHPAVEVKDTKDLFTTFAEVTFDFDSVSDLFAIAFAYLPANIEIITPSNLEFKNADLNSLLNAIVNRLHNYDAITKKALADKSILIQKLAEVAPNLFKKESLSGIQQQETLKKIKTAEKKSLPSSKSKISKKSKKK